MVRTCAPGAGLAQIPPGPALGAALAGLQLGELPNDQVIDVLQAQSRQLAHEQARMLATLVEVSRTTPGVLGPWRSEEAYEWASGEVSAALSWTARTADRELAFAETVVARLPLVFAALWDGRIDRAKAWVFADHLDPSCTLTEQHISAICAQLVPLAERLTTGELAARLLRAIIAIDPDHARRRYTRAVREREVISYLDRDSTVTISAHRLSSDEAAAATERLGALAKAAKRAGHPGRLPQIQADLFCGLLNGRYHNQTQDEIIADLLAQAGGDDEAGPPDPHGADTRSGASGRSSGARAGVEIRVGFIHLFYEADELCEQRPRRPAQRPGPCRSWMACSAIRYHRGVAGGGTTTGVSLPCSEPRPVAGDRPSRRSRRDVRRSRPRRPQAPGRCTG